LNQKAREKEKREREKRKKQKKGKERKRKEKKERNLKGGRKISKGFRDNRLLSLCAICK